MKKKITALLLALVLVLSLAPAAFAAQEIGVTVDGLAVEWTDAKPFIDENNRTLVPLRAVADAMQGVDVVWDQASKSAIFTENGEVYNTDGSLAYSYALSVTFTLGSKTAQLKETDRYADGTEETGSQSMEMDTAAVIVNGRTYAPIRYLAEAFGYTVSWDNDSRTVVIASSVDYILYWDVFTNQPDCVGIYFYPGELYEQMQKVETVAARVNGQSAAIEVLSESQLAELNREFLGENTAIYAFYIKGTFADSTDGVNIPSYDIQWDIRWTYADGTVDPELETCQWTWDCEGYGGY